MTATSTALLGRVAPLRTRAAAPDRRRHRRAVALAGVVAVVEGGALVAVGASPAVAVLGAAPLPLGAVHDLALVAALPLPTEAALATLAVGVVARGLWWRVLTGGPPGGGAAGVGRAIGVSAGATAAMALPAALAVTAGVIGVAALTWGVLVLALAVAVALSGVVGSSAARVVGVVVGVTAVGALVHAGPPVAGGAAAGIGAAALTAAHHLPGVSAPLGTWRQAGRRLVVLLVVPALVAAGGYALLEGAPSRIPGITAAPVRAADGGGEGPPILVVDGFGTMWRARPPLGGSRPVWAFSYAGAGADGLPQPDLPADTARGVRAVVPDLVAQVRTLAAAHRDRVTVVGISQGALLARTAAAEGRLDGLVDRLVLVDLPAGVGYLAPADRPGGDAVTGAALAATAWLVELVSPLQVDPAGALPRELAGCRLPSPTAPTGLAEVRFRSITDSVAEVPAAPPDVRTGHLPSAHALTLRVEASRTALRGAAAGDPPASGGLDRVAAGLEHLAAPWRLPPIPGACGIG
ncbi:hypothetical protein [Euzebya sp.]|uniref:hypothetical protein n=1 Tax=Euzebya sp. TaxID=1971409 RepID=UPI003514D865